MRHIIYLLLIFPFIILADSVEVVQTQTQDSRIKNEEKRSENLNKDVYEKDKAKEKNQKLKEPMYVAEPQQSDIPLTEPAEPVQKSETTPKKVTQAKTKNSEAVSSQKKQPKKSVQKKGSASAKKSDENKNILMNSPASEDKAVLESGIMLYNSSNFAASIEKFKQLKEKFPQSIYLDMANQWLARAYMKSGNNKDAFASLDLIPQTSGEFPAALFLSGQIFFAMKDYVNASERFHRVASQFPSHDLADDALINLSKTNLFQGNGNLAVDNLLNVIKNYSDREMVDDAYYNLAKVYEKDKMLRDLEKARSLYRKFIEKSDSGEQFFSNSPLKDRVKRDLADIDKRFFSGGR
ncbi:MAG TPA: tetratricopeptide repeat protein [Spirochaetota bacterium]|nr:tetratricopeptide repeat protein [Spirochaetota bacterium]